MAFWTIRRITPADADAGRRNMRLLIQLRWLAVIGQLVTIAFVHRQMGIDLPLGPLLLAVAGLVVVNLGSLPLLYHRSAVSNEELTAALLVDVTVLTWQLYHSGGIGNPFVSLYLLQIVLGAILLKPATAWAIVAASFLAIAVLALAAPPLALPPRWQADPMGLYLWGSLVGFALIAVLLVLFVARVSRNLSKRDAALAAVRQQAAEEDHIVRMGLLASGAAHELGTPLASMAVLVGDWKRLPPFASDAAMREELDDMETAIARCKSIVGDILNSAGEARGIAPERSGLRSFLSAIVADWRAARPDATLLWLDQLGDDVTIVADVALRQVIGNAIDNALAVSPGWVAVSAWRDEATLLLEVLDQGPGFSAEMLQAFGRPYQSTKGRAGGGLGLFLLVNVVRKLGGTATAFNRPEGGACVRIALPLATLWAQTGPA